MEQQSDIAGDSPANYTAPRRKRKSKAGLFTPQDIGEAIVAPKGENEDLNLHTILCAERYKQLEGRLDALDNRLTKLEDKVAQLSKQQQEGFNDIKILLERKNTVRHTQLIATFGTIVTAILGFIGYIIAKT